MSVWLSTTLISALRNMIDLWTEYFEVMQEYLDGLLDILVACICQGESSRVESSLLESTKSTRVGEIFHLSPSYHSYPPLHHDPPLSSCLSSRGNKLTDRKRYPSSNRYILFPTTTRIQRSKTLTSKMGKYRLGLRPIIYDYNGIPIV
jgi:hypothetical protein